MGRPRRRPRAARPGPPPRLDGCGGSWPGGPHREQDGGFRGNLRPHARHARELADAAQHALYPDVELELVARNHRLLEARVVDADVVIDVLVVVGALVAADD